MIISGMKDTLIVTLPPLGVNFNALLITFLNTWSILNLSAIITSVPWTGRYIRLIPSAAYVLLCVLLLGALLLLTSLMLLMLLLLLLLLLSSSLSVCVVSINVAPHSFA